MLRINNLPDRCKNKKYIVCDKVNNEYWYYGAFDELKRAQEVAKFIDGEIIENGGE